VSIPADLPDERRLRTLRGEALGVAICIFIVYAIARPDPVATLGRLYDDSVYLSIGKSIADGTGYRSAQLVGTPVHVKFPPLLPAVYSVAWRMFGTLEAVATTALWLNIVVTAVSAGLLWWLARRELHVGPLPAALFCITPLVTARTMFYFSGAMGEPWMLLGWATALCIVRRLVRRSDVHLPATGTAIALGLTLAATILARTQALAVALGMLAALLTGVNRRLVVTVVASMLGPLVVWNLWHAAMMRAGPLSTLPDQVSYLSWIPLDQPSEWMSYLGRVGRMTSTEYWSTIPVVLVGWESTKTALLAAVLLLVGGAGMIVVARRFPALAHSLLATIVVLLLWPYAEDRFLTPVLPVLGLAAAYATQQALGMVPTVVRRGALAGVAALTVFILGLNARTRRDAIRGEAASPFVTAMARITAWVSTNTTPNDHIMAPWGGVIYLRTGRRTSIGNPEEAAFATSVLSAPERFYASRLMADSVDVVVIWDRAPGRSAATLRSMGASCPNLLTESTDADGATDAPDVHFYRVRRDVPCLEQFMLPRTVEPPTKNKNAP
jgi:hypothetical protein